MITVRVEQGDDPTKTVRIHVFSAVDGEGHGLYHGTLQALPGVAEEIIRALRATDPVAPMPGVSHDA